MILQRIGVVSGAKMLGAVYAGLGLIGGAIFSLFAMLQGAMLGANSELGGMGGVFGMLFGVGAIILFPLFYGLMGFVVGALGAFIYNLVSGFVGGLELTMVEKPAVGALGMGSVPPAVG